MNVLTGYEFNWTLVTWHFPMDTAAAKRAAAGVRRRIRRHAGAGRYWGNAGHGAALLMGHREPAEDLVGEIPPDGRVDFLGLTDKQFGAAVIAWGAARKPA
jgi:CRISPR/Cas system-associated protein endoribonuclease Cas2